MNTHHTRRYRVLYVGRGRWYVADWRGMPLSGANPFDMFHSVASALDWLELHLKLERP